MSLISWIATLIILTGLALYGLSLFAAFVLNLRVLASFRAVIMANLGRNVGMPASAVSAFCIVIIFWELFPPAVVNDGIALELFGLGFTGPTGPVTLWISCFATFIFGIKVLSHKQGSDD